MALSKEQEFEFRARLEAEMEAEQGNQIPSSEPPKQSTKRGFFESLSPNQKTVMEIGLPTLGAIAAETAAIPMTGGMSGIPLLMTLGAAGGLGSLGGEAVNQAIGVKPFDMKEQGIAAFAPLGGRVAFGALTNIPRMLPGMATAIKAAHLEDIKGMAEKLLPGPSAEHIYSQIGKASSQKMTQFPHLDNAAKALSEHLEKQPWEELSKKLNENGLGHLAEQIREGLKGVAPATTSKSPTVGGKALPQAGLPKQPITTPGQPAGLTFDEVRAAHEGLNKMISGSSDPAMRGEYIKLKKALLTDMENMGPIQGIPILEWKAAKAAATREYARTSLQDATERSIVTKDGVDIPHPDRIISYLRSDKGKEEIMNRLGGQEYRRILNSYRELSSKIGHDMPRLVAMLMGGTAGAMLDGGAGAAAIGAGSGYMLSEQLTKLTMSDAGRKFIRFMTSNPRTSPTRRTGAAVGAGLAGLQGTGTLNEEE